MNTRFSYGPLFQFLYLFVLKTAQVNRSTSLAQKMIGFRFRHYAFLLSLIITFTIQNVATGPG